MPYADTWGDKAKKRSRNRNEYFKIYKRNRDKQKVTARNLVAYAVKQGKLVPSACKNYGSDCKGRIEAHHGDYLKPLDVTWVCSKHHRDIENELNQKSTVMDRVCANCGVSIKAPKSKYCSNKCNLVGWRKGF